MTANDVFEYFSQDPTAAPWKFQDIKFGIVWRIYMGMPHEACWGGFEKKNLHWLDEWLRNQKGIDRMSFIRNMGGLLLLWRSVQPLIRIRDFQISFLIPHVDIYSLAWLFHLTDRQIDLERIWKNQKVSDSILNVLKPMSQIVWKHILDNSDDLLCTEYTKSRECWQELLTQDFILPDNIRAEYIIDRRYIVIGDILIGVN